MPGTKRRTNDPDLAAARERSRTTTLAPGMAPRSVVRSETGIGPTVTVGVRGPLNTNKLGATVPVTVLSVELAPGETASRLPLGARGDDTFLRIAPQTKLDGARCTEPFELRMVDFHEIELFVDQPFLSNNRVASWDTPQSLGIGCEVVVKNACVAKDGFLGQTLRGQIQPNTDPITAGLPIVLPDVASKAVADSSARAARSSCVGEAGCPPASSTPPERGLRDAKHRMASCCSLNTAVLVNGRLNFALDLEFTPVSRFACADFSAARRRIAASDLHRSSIPSSPAHFGGGARGRGGGVCFFRFPSPRRAISDWTREYWGEKK